MFGVMVVTLSLMAKLELSVPVGELVPLLDPFTLGLGSKRRVLCSLRCTLRPTTIKRAEAPQGGRGIRFAP